MPICRLDGGSRTRVGAGVGAGLAVKGAGELWGAGGVWALTLVAKAAKTMDANSFFIARSFDRVGANAAWNRY